MLIAGEGGEQGNFASPEIALQDDKKIITPTAGRENASAGLVTTLQQEIHAVVDHELQEKELVQELATKEYI